ncbi:hypothetical protein INT45_009818 [Circinella minor]|uniref:Uncharacterized protein n=1 Tax=Circinella minor TaxID=1195481 RepID=A0A8H7S535_9FUNG|nr:hypothetical protein INT45_009818 [Circinella minor]
MLSSCHSFILDLGDEKIRKEFTQEELDEICRKNPHPLPPATPQLLDYVNGFINLTTIDELEKRVRKRMFDFDKEFILDWAQYSLQTVIRLFHSNFFPITDQTEGDMIRRIWNFIDYAFDNMKVDIRTGEMESAASAERRNEQLTENGRKLHGHKTDLLIKVVKGEIGCTEVGKKDHGVAGSKETKELGLKVPKMLKDQLYNLSKVCPEKVEKLVVVGFVMMGLKLRVVVMDNPSTYVCRINRTDPYYFPSTVVTVGNDFGAMLILISQVRELVDQTIKKLNEPYVLRSMSFANVVSPPTIILPCAPSPKLSPKKTQ